MKIAHVLLMFITSLMHCASSQVGVSYSA